MIPNPNIPVVVVKRKQLPPKRLSRGMKSRVKKSLKRHTKILFFSLILDVYFNLNENDATMLRDKLNKNVARITGNLRAHKTRSGFEIDC